MAWFCNSQAVCPWISLALVVLLHVPGPAQEPSPELHRSAELQSRFDSQVVGVLDRYCAECHNATIHEADIDLSALRDTATESSATVTWLKVMEQLTTDQMPPVTEPQPTDAESQLVHDWLSEFLRSEAMRDAGDPGPVILRRLNNAEYTYTVRDLTGLANLDPAKEFPVDGAAGEGFSNTGAALPMSPALVQKFLDSGKDIAEHAVLLSDGFRFEDAPSPNDMTNALIDRIRRFYSRYTDALGGDMVNLQGIVFETNQGGRLPTEAYIAGTLALRDHFAETPGDRQSGRRAQAIRSVAETSGLNIKYLQSLWEWLDDTGEATRDAGILSTLRARWRSIPTSDAGQLSENVVAWQKALWRFNSIGHIGKKDGPTAWQEPIDPLQTQHALRYAVPNPKDGQDAVLYLNVTNAGDGTEGDVVVLERPRLVSPGRPDLLLSELNALTQILESRRSEWDTHVAEILLALDGCLDRSETVDWERLASEAKLPVGLLKAWSIYLGLDASPSHSLTGRTRLTQPSQNVAGLEGVMAWVGPDALSIVANPTNKDAHIPGHVPPGSIAVHPSPSLAIAMAWRAPESLTVTCSGWVRPAHAVCGNGIAWRLELRRGALRQSLASGVASGDNRFPLTANTPLYLRANDELILLIEPRDGNHACDLTNIDLEIRSLERVWSLASDTVPNLIEGNPHADRQGRKDVWEFFSEPVTPADRIATFLPADSLLSQWLNEPDSERRRELSSELEALIANRHAIGLIEGPDRTMLSQIDGSTGPFFMAAMAYVQSDSPRSGERVPVAADVGTRYGIDPLLFGGRPEDTTVSSDDCVLRAPMTLPIRIAASLGAGVEFVATGRMHGIEGQHGSVQLTLSSEPPVSEPPVFEDVRVPQSATVIEDPNWSTPSRRLITAAPILVSANGEAELRFRKAFNEFRNLFPIALCYPKIVPVDEVVTLTLFHREDEPLQRLMLSDDERAELDRLWEELHFVSHDAIQLVDAYEQLWQYATQDADPSAFEPMRASIYARAETFRNTLAMAEPAHVEEVLRFAEAAYRGAWKPSHAVSLRSLYRTLRAQDWSHEASIRMMIARVLVSTEFLYRIETPQPGRQPTDVLPMELANRLSYFLWSSAPDAELLERARDGSLTDPATLTAQVQRMRRDPKIERMAIEFGCMWLQIRDFDQLDEKSETHFPEFSDIRAALYLEVILMMSEWIRTNGSIQELVDADHTYLNDALAKYYGIPNIVGPQWRRVDGVQAHGRGGILGLGATLAKQSGASRTSPILRGTWMSEVLLGEKLPKPPKNVPVLAQSPPEGMTERQLIAHHTSDPACARCHRRIDPFGFALEGYDAIGRFRQRDALGMPIDADTVLPDGTPVSGMPELRRYLATTRFEDFVRHFDRKLLGYALGRSIQLSDQPLLDQIFEVQNQHQFRIEDTLVAICLSPQFRQIRGIDFETDDSHASASR